MRKQKKSNSNRPKGLLKNKYSYNGNPKLKGANVPVELEEWQILELMKCKEDPKYFIETYMKIVNIDGGLVPFNLYDYQKKLVDTLANNRFVSVCTARQVGKCLFSTSVINIRNKETKEIVFISIEDFYNKIKLNISRIQSNIDKKFIESYAISNFEIETDTGWSDISFIHKTIEYEIYELATESGLILKAADDHILFDENFNEIYLKDCSNKYIQTKNGLDKVISITNLNYAENMYDVTVNDNDHRFYSNDILSHNSTVTVGYACWFILFNEYKPCAILANKAATSREILGRLQLAYENLPLWLQQGVVEWNKGSILLENGSSIEAAATSSSSIRGKSKAMVMIDECVHGDTVVTVKNKLTGEILNVTLKEFHNML